MSSREVSSSPSGEKKKTTKKCPISAYGILLARLREKKMYVFLRTEVLKIRASERKI